MPVFIWRSLGAHKILTCLDCRLGVTMACQDLQAEHMNMRFLIDCIDDDDAIMDVGPAHRLIP